MFVLLCIIKIKIYFKLLLKMWMLLVYYLWILQSKIKNIWAAFPVINYFISCF